jgi:outer membrane protein assembly factor BamB
VVIGDTVITQVEAQGDSFATGLNTATGETRWVKMRSPEMNWCSPVELRGESGKSLALLQDGKGLTAVDPTTGDQVWSFPQASDTISSAVVADGRIIVASKGITALRASTDSPTVDVLWSENKLAPGAASPVAHDNRVYTVDRAPVLSCANASNGKIIWEQRLKGAFWATPLIAGDYIYCLNYEGDCQVVKPGKNKAELVATNTFGEKLQGSPAVADNAMYIRSDKHLWKIAETK